MILKFVQIKLSLPVAALRTAPGSSPMRSYAPSLAAEFILIKLSLSKKYMCSPGDVAVPPSALGLRFLMFLRPTLWAYVFLCLGASGALARRLCSESLPT